MSCASGGQLTGQLLEARTIQVNTLFLHHGNDLRTDSVPRRCTGRLRSRLAESANLLKNAAAISERPTFPNTSEDDGLHGSPNSTTDSKCG